MSRRSGIYDRRSLNATFQLGRGSTAARLPSSRPHVADILDWILQSLTLAYIMSSTFLTLRYIAFGQYSLIYRQDLSSLTG